MRRTALPGSAAAMPPPRGPQGCGKPLRWGSPAALAPLAQLRPFLTQRGRLPVTGVDDGVVVVLGEDPRLNIINQRGEVLPAPGFAHSAGKERVPGEDVGGTVLHRVGE